MKPAFLSREIWGSGFGPSFGLRPSDFGIKKAAPLPGDRFQTLPVSSNSSYKAAVLLETTTNLTTIRYLKPGFVQKISKKGAASGGCATERQLNDTHTVA